MTRTIRKTSVRRMGVVRAIVAAGALALAAGVAQSASAATEYRSPAAERLDTARPGTGLQKVAHRERFAEQRATRRSHREMRRHERRFRTLDRRDVVKVLHRRGYHKVHHVRRVGRIYRAEAVSRHGRAFRVFVNARTGRIVDVQRLHWPRPAYRW
ncbi:YpeB-like protein with putative protease inhibitory function [Breoghania corrubedonensis]|uniref:YpeB-like protein with putative protease inhibitory function n=1 Tax=Breoghania corrubedonensis TaxID=665038 RepID=A0A2T5V6V4_9HYPH|nr:hypothetical protein [Breoghania corrubedonensis]PTW59484.1 YpeB-like protein with putative protease inhibitory function [Breoghania corrubedonensis]